jgi:hypothetical protein
MPLWGASGAPDGWGTRSVAVHLLHGCAEHWDAGLQSSRNFVSVPQLRTYLKRLDRKYEKFADTPNSPHVLTVDDAIRGAADVCRIARELGHEVTLFVNPYNIEAQKPYFFTLFDSVLDGRQSHHIRYAGIGYDLQKRPELGAFRLKAKEFLLTWNEAEAIEHVMMLSRVLCSPAPSVPKHALVISLEELAELHRLGVSIESHGWTHAEIRHLSDSQFAEHIARAKAWLAEKLGIVSDHYAVPFGLSSLSEARRALVPGEVFLAHPGLEPGRAGGHFNRVEITAELRAS